MKTILQITPSGAKVSDLYGDSAVNTPELILFSRVDLTIDLRSVEQGENGMLVPFALSPESVQEWYFALDRDFDSSSSPKLLVTSGISLEVLEDQTLLHISIPNTGSSALVQDMQGKASQNYTCEIGGFDSDARAVVTWQFEIAVKNRIYPGNTPPDVISDPQYLTAAQVKALISGATGFTEEQLAEI